MKPNFLKTTALISGLLILSACGGPKDIDKIADAQNCLDGATTSSQASTCMAKVDGIESSGAYLIRCAGNFLKEGYNLSRISSALTSISGTSTGSSGSLSMMAALAFQSSSDINVNAANSQQTLDYCNRASSKGLILLAGLANTSTSLAKLGGLGSTTNMTSTQLQTLMSNLATDPNAQATVGNAVVSIYQASCANNSTTNGNYCQQFNSAVQNVPGGTSNPDAIGQMIMTCYTAPTTPGCTGF